MNLTTRTTIILTKEILGTPILIIINSTELTQINSLRGDIDSSNYR